MYKTYVKMEKAYEIIFLFFHMLYLFIIRVSTIRVCIELLLSCEQRAFRVI